MPRQSRTRLAARRFRLVLEEPADTPDELGGAHLAFTPLATLWGAIEPIRGDEPIEAGRIQGVLECRITLAFREGVTPRMRLRLGTRLFPIVAAFDPDGQRRFLICHCEEIVS